MVKIWASVERFIRNYWDVNLGHLQHSFNASPRALFATSPQTTADLGLFCALESPIPAKGQR